MATNSTYPETTYTRTVSSSPLALAPSTSLDNLGLYTVMLAYGHEDENRHAPDDEFFRLP